MRRAVLTALIVAATAALWTSEADAQLYFGNSRFGIGIGVGPSYRGYGGYGYPYGGFGYGPGVGGMYGNYMVPGYPYYGGGRSNYYDNRTYVPRTYVPQRTIIVQQPEPAYDGLPIKIVSPRDAGVPITYALNQYEYTIEPGEAQNLVNDRQWIVRFDRGGDFGTAEYSLSPGRYEFSLSDQGWELYHSKMDGSAGAAGPPPSPDAPAPTGRNSLPPTNNGT